MKIHIESLEANNPALEIIQAIQLTCWKLSLAMGK
jgi:hypothetical protein